MPKCPSAPFCPVIFPEGGRPAQFVTAIQVLPPKEISIHPGNLPLLEELGYRTQAASISGQCTSYCTLPAGS